MRELLNKCNHDQLVKFARDCAKHAKKYVKKAKRAYHFDAYIVDRADYAVEDAKSAVENAISAAESVAEFTREVADYAGIREKKEQQRQIEFLANMLEKE